MRRPRLQWIVLSAVFLTASAVVRAQPLPEPCLMDRIMPDGSGGGQFGFSLAIDGELAVVGAPLSDGFRGRAEVFQKRFGRWEHEQTIHAFDGLPGDSFGSSVAVQGNTVLVGSPHHDLVEGQGEEGAVYVYHRSSFGWSFQAKFTSPDPQQNEGFGTSLDVEDGIALVGAPGRDNFRGSAWVFQEGDVQWFPLLELVPSDAAEGDHAGQSVALDRRRALVGGPFHDGDGMTSGGAWLFGERGGEVVELQKLVPTSLLPGDRMGHSVALDGSIALVGAVFDDDAAHASGTVFVFAFDGTDWIGDGVLSAPDATGGENFGWSVAVNGKNALIGALRGHAPEMRQTGSAYFFRRTPQGWQPRPKLLSLEPVFLNELGSAVALDDGTALIGADGEDGFSGAAYFLDLHDEDEDGTADTCEPCQGDPFEPDQPCDPALAINVAPEERRVPRTLCPANERDLFEFTTRAGVAYRFATEGATDTAMALLTETCDIVFLKNDTCDGEDENSCLSWFSVHDVTLKVLVTGPGLPGAYDLVFQETDSLPPCEPDGFESNDDCATATPIAFTEGIETLPASLCGRHDVDTYRFEVEQGVHYKIRSTGPTDTQAILLDANCRPIAENDDCDLPGEMNFCLEATADRDAVFFLRVLGAFPPQTTGPYTLVYESHR